MHPRDKIENADQVSKEIIQDDDQDHALHHPLIGGIANPFGAAGGVIAPIGAYDREDQTKNRGFKKTLVDMPNLNGIANLLPENRFINLHQFHAQQITSQ